MRKTILSEDAEDKGTHVDASIIGNQIKSEATSSLVAKISSEPTVSASRVKLVRTVLQAKRDFPLSLFRNLMMQAALTIYLGDITPATLQIAGQTYRLYLEKIISTRKKELLVVHSEQLKNVNLDLITVKDLIRIDEDQKIDDSEKLVIQGKSFFAGLRSAKTSKNKYMLVSRKTLAALEIIKRIPVLHSIGMKVVSKLQEIDSKLPIPYLMEARFNMQALQILALRVVMKDSTARPSMTPTFNKAIVAYHKSLKRASFNNPKSADITVLAEFAQISYYAYEQRKMLGLANHGVFKILEMGKKAVDVLAPSIGKSGHRAYLKLQRQILKALKSMKSSFN